MAEDTNEAKNQLYIKPVVACASVVALVESIICIIICALAICVYEGGIVYQFNKHTIDLDVLILLYLIKPNIDGIIVSAAVLNGFVYFYLISGLVWMILSGWMLKDWNITRKYTDKLFASWSSVTLMITLVDLILMSLISCDISHYVSDCEMNVHIYNAMWFVLLWSAKCFLLLIANFTFAVIIIHYSINIRNDSVNSCLDGEVIKAYEENHSPWHVPWRKPSQNPLANNTSNAEGYENNAFVRGQSFLNEQETTTPIHLYNTLATNINVNNSQLYKIQGRQESTAPNYGRSISDFSMRSENSSRQRSETQSLDGLSTSPKYGRLAKIGNHGRNSPLTNIPPPKIPDKPEIPPPDYTPPSSPKLRPVLRNNSRYDY